MLPLQATLDKGMMVIKGYSAFPRALALQEPRHQIVGPASWGCRIHQLHLCRGEELPHRGSCIWHRTIWWQGSSNAGDLGNAEYPFIAIAPESTLTRSNTTWKGPINGSNRTKRCTYAKLNCLYPAQAERLVNMNIIYRILVVEGSYLSVEMESTGL